MTLEKKGMARRHAKTGKGKHYRHTYIFLIIFFSGKKIQFNAF